MELKLITLSDGQRIGVPEQEWPWVVEYTWTYEPMRQQIYRVENGRPIYFFNELLKHPRQDRDLLTLSDAAVDAMFRGTLPYDKLLSILPHFIEVGKDGAIVFPNPYELVSAPLAQIVLVYYRWLLSRRRWVLCTDSDEQQDASMLHVSRDETYPYAAADQYPRLRDWMYGEWTGQFDTSTNPPSPQTYLDTTTEMVLEIFRRLMATVNPILEYHEIEDFFAQQGLDLSEIPNTIHCLLETYLTPAL